MQVENLEVEKLKRDSLHEQLNIEKDVRSLLWLEESINRHGKIIPILYVNKDVDGVKTPHVVDGWSGVLVAKNSGQEKIQGICIDSCPVEELPELVASLHANFHNDPAEEYKRYKFFYNMYAKGKGYRSDLVFNGKTKKIVKTVDEVVKKRITETPHKTIGRLYNVSESRVKSILKIGDTNKEYFDRIKKDRYSVYGAYSACVDEDKKKKQSVPKEKDAVMFNPDSNEILVPRVEPSEVNQKNQNSESVTIVKTQESIPKLVLKKGEAIPETIEYQSEDGVIHSINLKQFIYHEK